MQKLQGHSGLFGIISSANAKLSRCAIVLAYEDNDYTQDLSANDIRRNRGRGSLQQALQEFFVDRE
jgi:hypothetical protein